MNVAAVLAAWPLLSVPAGMLTAAWLHHRARPQPPAVLHVHECGCSCDGTQVIMVCPAHAALYPEVRAILTQDTP